MKRGRVAPLRPLFALLVAVLGAHLLLLQAVPGPLHLSHAAAAKPFITRSIAAEPERESTAAPVPEPVKLPRQLPPRRSPAVARVAALEVNGETATKKPAAPLAAVAAAPADLLPSPLTAIAAPVAAQPIAFAIPGSVRLHYTVTAEVRRLTWSGVSELVWRHDADSYEARLEISAPLLPSRTQRSSGRITAEGLAPERFSDRVRSEEAAHFEREKGKVSFSSNQPDVPLRAGAQDRLSVLLQLGAMIGGEPHKFPPGTTIAIQTAGTRDAELWLFTVGQEEELQLPGGAVSAVKITRNPRKEFDQKVELWLAPAMDYVVVRLRLTQPNGDSVDQQWSSTDRG